MVIRRHPKEVITVVENSNGDHIERARETPQNTVVRLTTRRGILLLFWTTNQPNGLSLSLSQYHSQSLFCEGTQRRL